MLGFCLLATCLREWRPWEGKEGGEATASPAQLPTPWWTLRRCLKGLRWEPAAYLLLQWYLLGGPIPDLLLLEKMLEDVALFIKPFSLMGEAISGKWNLVSTTH